MSTEVNRLYYRLGVTEAAIRMAAHVVNPYSDAFKVLEEAIELLALTPRPLRDSRGRFRKAAP